MSLLEDLRAECVGGLEMQVGPVRVRTGAGGVDMFSHRWFVFLLAACACDPEALQAPDRSPAPGEPISVTHGAHNLRAAFEPEGVLISGRTGGAADVRMSLRSWGREGALEPGEWVEPEEGDCAASAAMDAERCLRRVHYVRNGLVEWWEDRSEGLEHGFTVSSPPPGHGLLVFDVVVDGAEVVVDEGDGTASTFSRPGAPSLYYTGLAAWDEGGRALPAWMEETDEGLRLVVDDADALGTVTVDPLLTLAWTAESDQVAAFFGVSVASAGDVNGDGYGDVVVGAHAYDNGSPNEGRAYMYFGSASGLEATAAWTAESDQESALFGSSVSSAGDVNGDGYGDIVVGAPRYDNGSVDEGRASLYLGSATGLETTAAWTAEPVSPFPLVWFGTSVSSAGDVNGDGYGDVVVGAPNFDNGSTDEGRAYLYLGSATGLAATAAWTAESNQAFALFGTSVSSAGDVNGDGYGDVVVGAHRFDNGSTDEGRAYLYLGSATGLAATAAWTAESDQASAVFGVSVSSAGDVNGDGYGDVVVGAHGYDNGSTDEGRAYMYLGSATGLAATAAWTAESDQAGSPLFGASVASAGDVNGDGYGDVVVGAQFYDNGSPNEGRAYMYLGSASGLEATAAWTAESDKQSALFGSSVSSAGDVNGDGYGDVVVGAPSATGTTDKGRAYLYVGGCSDDDSDSDGLCDSDDICPGGDDNVDTDGDSIPNACDACPNDAANDADADTVCGDDEVCPGFNDLDDFDDDGTPDGCDDCPVDATGDTDGDFLCDSDDPCPLDNPNDSDGDGVCNSQDVCADGDDNVDSDGDAIADHCDNCPEDVNNDADGDGICGNVEICPGFDDTEDRDGDGAPDGCDVCPDDFYNDSDGDGPCDSDDACPLDNPDDPDGDGVCTAVDLCREGDDNTDGDGDGAPDACDACPIDAENDVDGDGLCESNDNCPHVANSNQADADGDGTGDACEPDVDSDGVIDDDDNCPVVFNPDQADFDADGVGDACDADEDGDGVPDGTDTCPGTPPGDPVHSDNGCSVNQACPCLAPWKNHGAYSVCVVRATNDLAALGVITQLEKRAIQSAARQSSCGE